MPSAPRTTDLLGYHEVSVTDQVGRCQAESQGVTAVEDRAQFNLEFAEPILVRLGH
jgi:hypothetical protein